MPYPQQNKAIFQDFGEYPAFKFIWHINTSYLYIYWSTGRNIYMQAYCTETHHFCRAAFPSEGCNSATWRASANAAQPASLLHVCWRNLARQGPHKVPVIRFFCCCDFFFLCKFRACELCRLWQQPGQKSLLWTSRAHDEKLQADASSAARPAGLGFT